MLEKEILCELVKSLDPTNYDYIFSDILFQRFCTNYLKNLSSNPAIASSILDDIKRFVVDYDGFHLTPANAKVGDGATVNFYTDRNAGTIVKVTKCSITVRRDKAIIDPNFKPQFVVGGFSAHCTNNNEQSYTYEPDENGELTTVRWSKKFNRYGTPDNITLSKGRHEFYDYNF